MKTIAWVAMNREEMEIVAGEHMASTEHGLSIEGPHEDGTFHITCLGGCSQVEDDQ